MVILLDRENNSCRNGNKAQHRIHDGRNKQIALLHGVHDEYDIHQNERYQTVIHSTQNRPQRTVIGLIAKLRLYIAGNRIHTDHEACQEDARDHSLFEMHIGAKHDRHSCQQYQ